MADFSVTSLLAGLGGGVASVDAAKSKAKGKKKRDADAAGLISGGKKAPADDDTVLAAIFGGGSAKSGPALVPTSEIAQKRQRKHSIEELLGDGGSGGDESGDDGKTGGMKQKSG